MSNIECSLTISVVFHDGNIDIISNYIDVKRQVEQKLLKTGLVIDFSLYEQNL